MAKTNDETGYGPVSASITIASGRPCRMVQPDQFALASGEIDIPNSAKRDIWELVLRYAPQSNDPSEQLLADEKWVRSHYYMAQLVLEPRVKLDEDDEKGVIDRRELSLPDLLAIYDFWRFGPAKHAARDEPEPTQDAVPAVGAEKGAE